MSDINKDCYMCNDKNCNNDIDNCIDNIVTDDTIEPIDTDISTKDIGRPTLYKKEYSDLVYKYCLLGATDSDLAKFFDIQESTLNLWKNKHPEFMEAIKNGREVADAEVASRLYQRAKGYKHEEIELKVVSRGNNEGSEVQQIPVMKEYAPDPISAIFWLKNRQPQKWRDKQEVQMNGDMTIEIKLEDE